MKKINVYSIVMNNFKNDTRVLKEALSLKKANYNVKVIALHDGMSDLKEFDTMQGVDVHRIKLLTKNWPKNIFVQMIKYFEFFIKAILSCRSTSVIHCNDLEPLPIAVCIKCLSFGKVKLVYDAHELETEQVENPNKYRKSFLVLLERICIKFTDKMMTVSNGIADEYVARYNVTKPVVIMNAPQFIEIKKKNLFREKFFIADTKRIFLYQGGLMAGRGIELQIQAFKNLHRDDAVLIIMGYGILEVWIKEKIKECDNIFFHEAVSPQVLLEYTSSADFGLCIIEDTCLSYYYCLPNKLFEYATAGLPVIVNDLHELSKLNNKYDIGIVLDELTEEALRVKIEFLLGREYEKLSDNARILAKENCWEVQEVKLLELYKELL